jgi:hypothetical protein
VYVPRVCICITIYRPNYDSHWDLYMDESVADAPPLGYFIYDASQDFHGQVVVF